MKVSMKRWEHQAVNNAKRFTKAWDYFCIASGSYIAGFLDARNEANSLSVGEEQVEYEVNGGDHQLTITTFDKWKEENFNLPFDEALKQFLYHYKFEEIRVHTDENELISFQGLARKK